MATNEQSVNDGSNVGQRTRAACDAYRSRKVKCRYNDGGTACQACLDLNVDCTRERPRKRRGPPSSYLEQEKRRKTQQEFFPSTSEAGQVTAENQSPVNEHPNLSLLAPLFVIQQVVDYWFELIHPLAPMLHRDDFLQQLNDPERHDGSFICLVVSVCAATVTALRRKALDYATTINVDKCCRLIRDLDRRRDISPATLTQCQIKYNLAAALASENGMDDLDSQLLIADATAIIGRLVHYDMQDFTVGERELVKRLYWLCFAGQCTLGLHSRPYLMPVNAFADHSSLKPRDISDKQLYQNFAADETWHGFSRSYTPGLNALTDLFMLWYRRQQGDTSNLTHLHKYLDLVLCSLDHIPPELRWRGGLSRPPRSNFGTDVQLVNLRISQIHIRSFLLEQMATASQDSQNGTETADILHSRQNLVNDMLAIVYQVPEDTLAANGNSLINKLRDIGLSLLNNSKSEMSFVNLDRLLAKLDRLDLRRESNHVDGACRTPASNTSTVFSPLFDLDPGTLIQT